VKVSFMVRVASSRKDRRVVFRFTQAKNVGMLRCITLTEHSGCPHGCSTSLRFDSLKTITSVLFNGLSLNPSSKRFLHPLRY